VLAILLVARGRSVVELLVGVYGAALAVSAFALTKLYFSSPPKGVFYRLSEPLGYPNALGLVAAIGALLAAAFAAHAGSRRARALSAGCLVVFVLTIFFTFSRGAWLSLVVGLAAMLALDRRRLALLRTLAVVVPFAAAAVWLGSRAHALTTPSRSGAAHQGHVLALETILLAVTAASATLATARISFGRRVSVAALVVLLAASATAIAHYGSGPKLGYLYNGPSRQGNNRLTLSLSGRAPLWRQAWRDWEANRALGSGAGTFEQYWLQHRRTSANVRDAHSLYLETLAELGPLGLALLVATLALPLVAGAKARFHPFAPAAFAAYLAFLIHAAGDWDWEMPAVTLLGLFCGAALLLAVRPNHRRAPSARARALALAGALMLASVAFAGLIGNGALDASANAASAGRWRQSASEARKAIRWLPWSSEAWRRLALAQSEEGRLAAARASLRTAIAKSPEEWRPWVSLMRLSTDRVQRRALGRAARLNPRDPEVVQFLLAPGSLNQRWSYDDSWIGWPVAPKHRQHQIRGSFLDPRPGSLRAGDEPAYHFGVDIAVRDDRPEPGAPPGRTHRVYAIEGGYADLLRRRLPGRCLDRKVLIGHFGYWHVDTAGVVRQGEYIRPGQMIGWTCKGLWHVHLAESMRLYGRRVYVNPIHPGMKLRPYADPEPPRVRAIQFSRPAMPSWRGAARAVFPPAGMPFPEASTGRAVVSGLVDVRAWIDDASAVLPPGPPYGIALEVIRESDDRRVLVRTVFRAAVFLGNSLGTQAVPMNYHYAPGTKQALPAGLCSKQSRACRGVYWFRLFARPTAAYWDTTRVADGNYRLRVTAWDAAGNSTSRAARVAISN
jgi:O-antigen ligase